VRLAFEFGYTTPAFRSMFGTNNGIAGQVFVHAGTPEQQARWLPELAAGSIAAFALTEAEAGSDPSGLTTRAVLDEATGDYVIDGAKRFITNAPQAAVFIVFARTGEPADGTKGISAFVVEADRPGLAVGPKDAKTGRAGVVNGGLQRIYRCKPPLTAALPTPIPVKPYESHFHAAKNVRADRASRR
jgi:acyl-CoA dehydrogenase